MNAMNKLSHVDEFRLKIYTSKFYESKEFYSEVLEYPLVDSWDEAERKGAMFDTGSGIIELLYDKIGYSSETHKTVDISLSVKDVKLLWDNVKGKVNVVFAIRHNSWGDTSFCISDPNGFKITFFTKDRKEKI
jgi:predicted enzyme related to lactoylglutathione lyase